MGSPPIALVPADLKVLVGIRDRKSQVQIAAAVKWSASKTCRRIKVYEKHDLVIRDAKTGQRVLNPPYFPKLVGKNKPPVVTAIGTSPGGRYKISSHKTPCYCEVLPSSKAVYGAKRKTLPVLNHMHGWDRIFIADADLGFFGANRFGNPDFKVISTSKGFWFWPWGWGDGEQEAIADAGKGAEELRDKLQALYGIKLGFTFPAASKKGSKKGGKPPEPHFSLHAEDQAPDTMPGGSIPLAGPLVVNGIPLGPDGTHPDDIEGVGFPAGKTLTRMKNDLESIPRIQATIDAIPQLMNDRVNAALQQLVQDAVSQAMQAIIPTLAGSIGQSVAQAMQAVIPQVAQAIKDGIQQAFAQAAPKEAGKEAPPDGQYT